MAALLASWIADADVVARAERVLKEGRRAASNGSVWSMFAPSLLGRSSLGQMVVLLIYGGGTALLLSQPFPDLELARSRDWLIYGLGLLLLFSKPLVGLLTKVRDADRLRVPSLAGLALFRWRRFLPVWLSVGACWSVGLLAMVSQMNGGGLQSVGARDAVAALCVLVAPVSFATSEFAAECGLRGFGGSAPGTNRVLVIVLRLVTQVTSIGLLWSLPHWGEHAAPTGVCIAVAVSLIGLCAVWLRLGLAAFERRGAETFGRSDTGASGWATDQTLGDALRPTAAAAALPREHKGRRGLLAQRLHLARTNLRTFGSLVRHRPVATVGVIPFLIVLALPLVAAAFAVEGAQGPLSMRWAFVATYLAWTMAALDDREVLFRMGVDLRDFARHNTLAALLGRALPTVLCGVFTALVCGPGPERWAMVALIAGLCTLRLGLGRSVVAFAAFLIMLVLVITWVGLTPAQVAWVAAIAGVIGVVGLVRSLRLSETAMRERCLG